LKNIFKDILKGKCIIVGVGNVLRGDDGFGVTLIERLKGNEKVMCINAGSAPENFAGKIVKEKPNTILIVDAVHMDLNPGESEILKKGDIVRSGFTTHNISLNMFIDYLENETGADVYLLGVQPKSVGFGEQMSNSVKKTLEEIVDLIRKVFMQ